MKKSLLILLILCFVLFASFAHAAWTITPTVDRIVDIKSEIGEKLIRVKLVCVSDASGTDYTFPGSLMGKVKDSFLYLVKIIPGAGADAPSAAFDLDIEDDANDHLLDTDSNATDATAFHAGSDTIGVFPPIFDHVSVVVGTLGNANTATIYLYFAK